MIRFGVVMPTRNRPALFQAALESVLAQRDVSFDVMVVNDGSDEACMDAYRAIERTADPRVRFVHLPVTLRGHGHSYALNFGVMRMDTDYVCFLDDDDVWTDPGHLERASRVIAGAEGTVDLYLGNQQAFKDGVYVGSVVWIENLVARMGAATAADPQGAYTVTVEDLLKCDNFAHLNTMTVRRPYFLAIGGLDESIRYENDRDFFLRAIDRARLIKHHPAMISRHNVPDPTRKANESTLTSDLDKRLSQLRVLDKAILYSGHAAVREYGKQHRIYAVKKIAEGLAREGRYDEASYYARQSVLYGFAWKWGGYSFWLGLNQLIRARAARRHDV